MNTLLRKFAEWKAKRKAAQVIVFDGAADIDRTKAFLKGGATGVAMTLVAVLLTAPSDANSELLQQLEQREALLRESNRRVEQATHVANVCLSTAKNLEGILNTYNAFLDVNQRSAAGPLPSE